MDLLIPIIISLLKWKINNPLVLDLAIKIIDQVMIIIDLAKITLTINLSHILKSNIKLIFPIKMWVNNQCSKK